MRVNCVYDQLRVFHKLTSARIILDEELVERHPAAADAHHDGGAENAHQAQLLRLSELKAMYHLRSVLIDLEVI